MIRLAFATVMAVLAVAGAMFLFGLACVVLRPFPDEHDGDDEQ